MAPVSAMEFGSQMTSTVDSVVRIERYNAMQPNPPFPLNRGDQIVESEDVPDVVVEHVKKELAVTVR